MSKQNTVKISFGAKEISFGSLQIACTVHPGSHDFRTELRNPYEIESAAAIYCSLSSFAWTCGIHAKIKIAAFDLQFDFITLISLPNSEFDSRSNSNCLKFTKMLQNTILLVLTRLGTSTCKIGDFKVNNYSKRTKIIQINSKIKSFLSSYHIVTYM